jgi:tRNA A37 methylthiotransferase MiaB
LLARQSEESNLKKINKTMEVLVESQAKKGRGDLMGRTRCYRKVIFPAGRDLVGQIASVQINEASSTILKGSLV